MFTIAMSSAESGCAARRDLWKKGRGSERMNILFFSDA